MKQNLSHLYPSTLWDIFADICSIPHPSKHEEQILGWMKNWAKEHNIEFSQDETGNMVFRKPATPGYENRVPIIFQGHIDMVPQANSDSNHNFLTDPIIPVVGEDGWLRATGTTLGADNGIGCAAAMAILVDNTLEHGPIEVLVTVDEETGMTGAFGLQADSLKGNILINLDSEDEGELYVGCAGGLDANYTANYTEEAVPAGMTAFEIAVTGLKGGHSGMDIVLGRANANKLLARLMEKSFSLGMRISSVNGGSLRNAIPREGFAVVTVPTVNQDLFKVLVADFEATVAAEYSATEPTLSIQVAAVEMPANVIDEAFGVTMVNAVLAIPNGVARMSDAMPGLVETSSNLAIFHAENGALLIANLLRSSVESAKEALAASMVAVADLAGIDIQLTGGYPGWKPNMESPILKTMMDVYQNKFGETPEIKAIHAGLECGLFSIAYPNWDMISCGPTIRNPHSPDERVNIETVGKFWDFLVETIKNVPTV